VGEAGVEGLAAAVGTNPSALGSMKGLPEVPAAPFLLSRRSSSLVSRLSTLLRTVSLLYGEAYLVKREARDGRRVSLCRVSVFARYEIRFTRNTIEHLVR
jgi:hypothetical protein